MRTGPSGTTQNFFFIILELTGKHLQCSNNKDVVSVFLPPGNKDVNYNLRIIATAKGGSFFADAIITAQVCKGSLGLIRYLN